MNEENNVVNTEKSVDEKAIVDTVNTTSIEAEKSNTEVKDIENENMAQAVANDEEKEKEFDASVLAEKSLEDIVAEAETVLVLTPKAAGTKLNAIREVFYVKYNEAKEIALSAYNEAKTEESEPFVFEKSFLADKLTELQDKVRQAKKEEKERIQNEQKKNLKLKEELLNKLEILLEQDETLESISEVKNIQKEWKTIRALPKDKIQELWDKFHYLLNKFYDNHSINIELKELDRQKNLEAKIELTKKVEALLEEKSLKRSFIVLNKYHEEFKNIGPVPQESREPIWQAFKSATDAVYEAKRKIFQELEAGKEENLKKKEILAEKAILVGEIRPETIKEWNDKTKIFEGLFDEWKKIGPVPYSNKDSVWTKFNGVRNDFYSARKEYFKGLNVKRNENLKKKEILCDQVEQLSSSTDWNTTTKEIIGLQAEWKKIGPVSEKVNQAIWNRFRTACDNFFNAKNEAFSGKREEEKNNLVKKEELLKQLQDLASNDTDHKDAFAKLKKINAEWRSVGFVPHKAVKKISKAYDEANNAVYKKYSSQIEEAKAANLSEHYKELKSSHNGQRALDNEERNVKRKIGSLRDEIASIERNMSFFSKSKTAEKMLKDFEAKIEKTIGLISKLKKELVAIKNAKKEDVKPSESDEPSSAEAES